MEQLPKHLDHFVVETLKALPTWQYPEIDLPKSDRNVFIGSGNAASVGKLFLDKFGGLYYDASDYEKQLGQMQDKNFASVNIVSASGGKDSLPMADFCQNVLGIKPNLITCNPEAPAKEKTAKQFVFPTLNDPPTYNTSTYGSMIYWLFGEDPAKILKRLEILEVPNLRNYQHILFFVNNDYVAVADMCSRKVNETLQGIPSNWAGITQGLHGMTGQPNEKRLLFTINPTKDVPSENRYDLTVDGHLEAMLLIDYIIGKNQTDQDTANIIEGYSKKKAALNWKFNKIN